MSVPKVRLGLLGGGAMGQRVADAAIRSDRFEIVSIADSNKSLALALASDYGATAYDDFGTLCAAGDLDAVYVGLPHHLHANACVAAADADLHVLIDKPLCDTLAEADRIRDAASASTRTWMVGFSYRYRAEWQRAEKIVSSHGIGAPYFVSDVIVETYEHLPQWYRDPTKGGGALQLQAHHVFDRLAWLLKSEPTEIACRLTRPSDEAELAASVLAVYPPGIHVAISVALSHGYEAQPRTLFVMQGSKGIIEIDGNRTLRHTTADGTSVETFSDDDWLEGELVGFARAVLDGDTNFPGIDEGRAALICALAAYRASESNEWARPGD